MDSRIFEEPRIDCHVHVFDPARFPYRADTHYAPSGQEMGTAAQLEQVTDAYGTRHALLVGPNSGYGLDNALHARYDCARRRTLQGHRGRRTTTRAWASWRVLRRRGVVGVAWNVPHYGLDHYRDAERLVHDLVALDMFVDLQVEHDQLVAIMPMLADSGVRILVDHCGRPTLDAGLDEPGFRALLELGATRRAFVKLSGLVKFSREPAPYQDAWPFVAALVDAFTLDHCLWGSDWPHLRAPARVDYGVLLHLALALLPDASDRRKVMWEVPRRLFGFTA